MKKIIATVIGTCYSQDKPYDFKNDQGEKVQGRKLKLEISKNEELEISKDVLEINTPHYFRDVQEGEVLELRLLVGNYNNSLTAKFIEEVGASTSEINNDDLA